MSQATKRLTGLVCLLHSPNVERFKQEIQLRYISAHVAKGSHCEQQSDPNEVRQQKQITNTNKLRNDRTNEWRNRLVKGGCWFEKMHNITLYSPYMENPWKGMTPENIHAGKKLLTKSLAG